MRPDFCLRKPQPVFDKIRVRATISQAVKCRDKTTKQQNNKIKHNMALGNQNQNSQSTRKLLILKLRSKDEAGKALVPNMFQVLEKNAADGKWVARPELQPRVSGNLVRVELDEGEYQGTKYGVVKLYLEDAAADELYLLDMRYNHLSRNLFNSLANLTSFNDLSISNYSTKSKKDGKEYANISLWQGKNMVKGKTEFTALPQPMVIKHPKTDAVISRDFTDVDAFFKPQLEELSIKVSASQTKISE